jgi:hypothetical protein
MHESIFNFNDRVLVAVGVRDAQGLPLRPRGGDVHVRWGHHIYAEPSSERL